LPSLATNRCEREGFLQGEEIDASKQPPSLGSTTTDIEPKGYIPTETISAFLASTIDFLQSRSEYHAETSTFSYFITPCLWQAFFFLVAGLSAFPTNEADAEPPLTGCHPLLIRYIHMQRNKNQRFGTQTATATDIRDRLENRTILTRFVTMCDLTIPVLRWPLSRVRDVVPDIHVLVVGCFRVFR
jgi:hypothetical protein